MSLLDALLPLAAGWAQGRARKQDRTDALARQQRQDTLDERRVALSERETQARADRQREQDAIAGQDRSIALYDAGFRDRYPLAAQAAAALAADTTFGGGRPSGVSLGGPDMSRFERVPGLDRYVLDPSATPEARSARASAAERAAKVREDAATAERRHQNTLEEIRAREAAQREFAPPRQPRAEPQGSIIQSDDGAYWRIVNGSAEPLLRPDGSPLRAPAKTGSSRGITLPNGRTLTVPDASRAGGDTAPNPALDTPPTPAQAAKYRELRARGVPPDQARAEAMQVR